MKIIKYDRKTLETMPDISFEFWRDGESIGVYTTDQQGEIVMNDLEPGTYLVKEVQTDNGHIADPTPQQIELKAGDGIRQLVFYNDQKPGIRLVKVDSSNLSKVIPNAKFSIRSVAGDYGPAEFTTDDHGEIDLSLLPTGAYVVTEVSAPEPYLIDDAVRIIQLDGNETAQFVFTDTRKPSLHLMKKSSDGTSLAGVGFQLARIEDGSRYLDKVTSGTGEILWEDLEPGVYSLKETFTVSDHILDLREYHVELFPGKTSEIVLENQKRPNLTIVKRDANTGEVIADTVFTVRAADGHSIDEVKTDASGRATLYNLLPGVYEVSEKSVPDAYLLDAPDQLVTLYPNRDHTVFMENHKKPTLTVRKISSVTSNPIENVAFNVTYLSSDTSSGEINDLGTFYTDANGEFNVTYLEGWYRVTELGGAAGYSTNTTPQEQFVRGGTNVIMTFEDVPLSGILVYKYDEVSKVALSNCVFRVRYLTDTSGTGGTVIGIYKTGPDGSFLVTGLHEGTYIIEEMSSDAKHVISTAPQTVYLSGKDQDVVTVYFGNIPKGSVLIRKTDGEGKPLSNCEFLVTDSSGAVIGNANGKYVTDAAGTALIENLDPDLTLVIKETRTKDETYVLDDTAQTIKVKPGETVTASFVNQKKGNLIILKLDSVDRKTPLEGVRFKLTYADGGFVDAEAGALSSNGIYTTDKDGMIRVSGIDGTVVVTEEASIDGYAIDESTRTQTVVVRPGDTQTLRVYNIPLQQIVVQKYIAGTTKGLEGVTFLVTDGAGAPLGGGNGEYVTDANGRITIGGLLPGMTVVAREVRTVKGYVLNTMPQTIIVGRASSGSGVSVSGSVTTVTASSVTAAGNSTQTTTPGSNQMNFYDERLGTLVICKYIEGTSTPISNTRFLITAGDGSAVGNTNGEYMTDANGRIEIKNLEPGTVITAKELRAADGYVLDTTPKSIEIKSGEVQELRFYNKKAGSLILIKKDRSTGAVLKGAEFQISYANGGFVGNFGGTTTTNGRYVTDDKGQIIIKDLQPSTIEIRELRAPDGYILDNTPVTVEVGAGDTQTVTVYNDPTGTLKLIKKDRSTGAVLKGAEFEISYANGEFVGNYGGTVTSNGRYVTDERGEIIIKGLQPSTVVIRELRAPDGYLLDNTPITVEIGANDTQTIEVFNDPQQTLTIQKYITGTTKPIAGVTFLITDSSGAILGPNNGEYVTDRNGRIVLTGLTPGTTITAKELKTAEGFVLDTTPQSILIKSGEAQTLTFFNSADGGVELIKVDANDKTKRLANATFELRRMDQGVVTTVTTGKDGRATADLNAGDYYAVEIEAPEGYKLDNTPTYFTVADGKTTTVTIKNKAFSGIEIHKIDAITGEGIYGVSFLLYDSKNNVVGQYTSDDHGYVRIEEIDAGRYRIRELENPGYIVDTQLKTVEVKSGEVTLVEWRNTPITGQIQILKTSADYNSMNGWPAGTPIPNTIFEVYNRAGKLVDTIKTDKNGIAATKPLPLGRYKVVESKAADFYGLDKTPIEVEIEFAGQIVKTAMTNKSLYTNVSITKRGYVEVMPGQIIRYDFSNIANNSTTALQSFYWRDTLPTNAVRLEKIVTGTWNASGNYKIVYKTNMSGGDYRVLADSLATNRNYVLNASPAALGLGSGEYVTEFMAVFGVVPANFRQVEAPQVYCRVLDNVSGGTEFCNTADVGGIYNGQWIMAVDRWVTRVYKPSTPLPRTGY